MTAPAATQGDRSRTPYRTGHSKPGFRLEINGRDATPHLKTASGTFAANGASTMALEVERRALKRVQGKTCSLFVGYGDPRGYVEYFTGKVEEPKRNPFARTDTCTVYGPYAEMESPCSMREDVSYGGYTVEAMAIDLGNRASQSGRYLEVYGGSQEVIEKDTISAETSPGEALSSICGAMSYVAFDKPGYRRVVMPTPSPGQSARSKAAYDETDVADEADLVVDETNATLYHSVIVFRRAEDGSYPVREEAQVVNRGVLLAPPENHIYWITDFPGTPSQAAQRATDEALRLSRTPYSWSLANIPLNPDLLLYDSITLSRTEYEGDRPFRAEYVALWDSDGSFEIDTQAGTMNMSIGGNALRTAYEPLVVRRPVKRSAGIVRLAPEVAHVPLTWDSDLTWNDLGDLTWENA